MLYPYACVNGCVYACVVVFTMIYKASCLFTYTCISSENHAGYSNVELYTVYSIYFVSTTFLYIYTLLKYQGELIA